MNNQYELIVQNILDVVGLILAVSIILVFIFAVLWLIIQSILLFFERGGDIDFKTPPPPKQHFHPNLPED